ncbi:MBG domain-containing protein, partial [Nocardioides bigeumensis]|uniref:MBG domain-containing protein n=1 Tax=Nocardioides bigeumensis TaxID=433657 RepID=UPI0031DA1351
FVLGQGPGALGGTLGFTTAATAWSNVGSYGVTPVGLTSDNYVIQFVDGSLDITKAPLTVTADAAPGTETVDAFRKVYGSPNPAFTVRYDGFVLGQGPGALGG